MLHQVAQHWNGLGYLVRRLSAYGLLLLLPALFAYYVTEDIRRCGVPWKRGLWDDAVCKSPESPRARLSLGRALQEKHEYERAIQEYRKVAELAYLSNDARAPMYRLMASNNIVQVLIDNEQFKTAGQFAAETWNEFPGYPGLAVNLSIILLNDNRPDLAIAILNQGIQTGRKQYPWFPEMEMGALYWNRGEAYRLLGNCQEALASYHGAKKFNPGIQLRTCP